MSPPPPPPPPPPPSPPPPPKPPGPPRGLRDEARRRPLGTASYDCVTSSSAPELGLGIGLGSGLVGFGRERGYRSVRGAGDGHGGMERVSVACRWEFLKLNDHNSKPIIFEVL